MSTAQKFTDSRGVKWARFLIEFDSQEGKFCSDIWAVDMPHALERLEEFKATARIIGQCEGVIPWKPPTPSA